MAAKIYLPVVEHEEGDSVFTILPELKGPLIKGSNPDEHLACGSCKAVLAQNTSTRELYERFVTPNRLLIQCRCGAYNRVNVAQV